MIPKTILTLCSGGLDSTCLLYFLRSEGHAQHAVLFDYGQKHVQELQWAKLHCGRLNILYTTITIPQLKGSFLTDDGGGVVVPMRNAIFLTLAANLAKAVGPGCDTLAYGCNKEDEAEFPDCRGAFVQTFNNMLMTCESNVQVWAPFIDKSKAWIVALARDLGVQLNETWSCYKGGSTPCGVCEACRKREMALR